MLAEIKADPDLRRIPVVVLTTSAPSTTSQELRAARELLHHEARRPRPVRRGGDAIEEFWLSVVRLPEAH